MKSQIGCGMSIGNLVAYMSFDLFARGLHTRTAVAHLPLRQLGFLVNTLVTITIVSDVENSKNQRIILTHACINFLSHHYNQFLRPILLSS